MLVLSISTFFDELDADRDYHQEKRKEANMSQKELSDYLHVTDKAISKWERGLSFPDISLLIPLSVTKIFTDKDKSDNFVRAGNNIIVDYQSGLLMGSLPSG